MEEIIPKRGQNYFVRTLSDHWIGECVGIGPNNWIALRKAAWVADSGKLSTFMAAGSAPQMEIEVLPTELIVRCHGTIIDWPHPLFTKTV